MKNDTMNSHGKGINVLISVLVALLAVMVPFTLLKACGAAEKTDASEQANGDAAAMAKAMQAIKDYEEKEAFDEEIKRLREPNEALKIRLKEIEDGYEKQVSEIELAKKLRDIELQKMNAEAEAEIAEIEAGIERANGE